MTSTNSNLWNYGIGWHIRKKRVKEFPCQKRASYFWQVNIFHFVLSGYSNLSHNFTNLVFLTSSLLFSIIQVIMVCDLKNTVSRY